MGRPGGSLHELLLQAVANLPSLLYYLLVYGEAVRGPKLEPTPASRVLQMPLG